MPGEVVGKISGDASGFKRAVEEAKSALDGLTDASKGTDDAGGAFDRAAGKVGSFAEAVRGAKGAFGSLAEGGKAVEDSLAGVASVTEDAQKAIEGTGEALAQLPKHAESLGEALESATRSMGGFTSAIEEVLPAIRPLQESLGATGDAIALLPERAASLSAPLQSVGSAVEDVSRQFGQYGGSVQETMAYNEEFAKTAQRVGVNLNELGDSSLSAASGMADFAKSSGTASDSVLMADSSFGKFDDAVRSAGGSMRTMNEHLQSSVSLGEAFQNAGEGIVGGLERIAQPLMAVQMLAGMVQQVGQSMYDAAGVFEGPAAHAVGTFTGQMDTLGHASQMVLGAFTEGVGQGLMPNLESMTAGISSGTSSMEGFGKAVGATLGVLGDLLQMGTGQGGGLFGGGRDLINTLANAVGLQQPFPVGDAGGGTNLQQSIQKAQTQLTTQLATIPQQLALQQATALATAADPGLLTAQAQLAKAQTNAAQAVQQWTDSHWAGSTGPLDPMNAVMQQQSRNMQGGGMGILPWQVGAPTIGPGGNVSWSGAGGLGAGGDIAGKLSDIASSTSKASDCACGGSGGSACNCGASGGVGSSGGGLGNVLGSIMTAIGGGLGSPSLAMAHTAMPDVIKPAPVTIDVIKPAPVTVSVVSPPPVTVSVMSPPPVTVDVIKPAPQAIDVIKPAPQTIDVVKPAPQVIDVVKPTPQAIDVIKPSPVPIDVLKPPPVSIDVIQPPPVMISVQTMGVPSFASGIENFEGGLAFVHQDELLMLPRGTNVRPASIGSPASGPTFLSQAPLGGAGAGIGASASVPPVVNVHVELDSQVLAQSIGMPLARQIRVQAGMRR